MSDSRAAGLARLAGNLADPTRACILLALLDGRAWTATELAAHAGVAASTVSEHLSRLRDSGLLRERRQGRHRYVELADPGVAQLIEDLAAHTPPVQPAGTLRAATAHAAMVRGRTCYDHLAGELGVALTDAFTDHGFLEQRNGFALTEAGARFLTVELGVDRSALVPGRRTVARPCLDWTQRRTHLAGVAGAQLCEKLLARGWVQRVGTGRAVRVTSPGQDALRALLGLRLE